MRWDGKGEPGRFAREAARIAVLLDPYVEAGKLKARLASLTISNRAGLSKFLPLESILRPIRDDELRKLNANPKFYKAPKPFVSEGFGYVETLSQRSRRA